MPAEFPTPNPESEEQEESKEATPEVLYSPREMLLEQAANHPRNIENCEWFKRKKDNLTISFDLPENPTEKQLAYHNFLTMSFTDIGIKKIRGVPEKDHDLVIGFDTIPGGDEDILDRTEQRRPPNASIMRDKHNINPYKSFALHVSMEDDLTDWKQRDRNDVERTIMGKLGGTKLINESPDHFSLYTMEGGFGSDKKDDYQEAISKHRDRLIALACAEDVSAGFKKIPDVVQQADWEKAEGPEYLAESFRQLGEWGMLAEPYDLYEHLDEDVAREYEKMLKWSRQSESAGAVHTPEIQIPEEFRSGEMTGCIVATKSGRSSFNIDKRTLTKDDTTPVSIVPEETNLNNLILNDTSKHLTQEDIDEYRKHYSNFSRLHRYALGVEGGEVGLPSVEFDEMAAALLASPLVRVSHAENGKGYRLDEEGEILLSRIRAFIHFHQAIEAVNDTQLYGTDAKDLIEHIEANLDDFPHPFGCGKDTTVEVTTDAVLRSKKLDKLGSGTQMLAFPAVNHGTNLLSLAEPIQDEETGEWYIPYNPLETTMQLINPDNKVMELTEEIPQI